MASVVYLLAIAILVIGSFIAFCIHDEKRGVRKANALRARLDEQPGDLELAQLFDGNQLSLWVQFRGEALQPVPTLSGLAAVRLFDRLRAAAPDATFLVNQGGTVRPADQIR
jgi:hypothetical protein